jgi:AraC-like DNA-binding protein
MKYAVTTILITSLHIIGFSQTPNLNDSVAIRVNQIVALQQSGDHERAQLEVEDLKWFVKREKAYFPAKSIQSIIEVYKSNRDEVSLKKFLEEASAAITNVKETGNRVELTNELVRVYEQAGQLDKALLLQKLLTADSEVLKSGSLQTKLDSIRHTSDSLSMVRQLETGERHHYYNIEKSRLHVMGGALLVALLALLGGQLMQRKKYERELEEKDEEIRHLKGFLVNEQHIAPITFKQPEEQQAPPTLPTEPKRIQEQTLEKTQNIAPAFLPESTNQMYQPKYIALLVEPNRQVAIYLKSLLGPEYTVELAKSMAEAMEMAQTEIPDIVITDTILDNNSSGIDLARHLKQDIKTNHVPIVLVTGATATLAEQEKIRAGADLLIQRPLLDDDFDAQLKELFKIRATSQHAFDHILQLWFTASKETPSDHFLNQALQQIERNIPDASFSGTDLARLMQYDKQVFNRKVIALTGREPHDIIRIMRLEKAKFLLENRVAPPQVIAGLVGFDNPGSFTRAFKEHFGDTTVLLLNA